MQRRSGSIATTTTATTVDEEDYDEMPEPRAASRGKASKKYADLFTWIIVY